MISWSEMNADQQFATVWIVSAVLNAVGCGIGLIWDGVRYERITVKDAALWTAAAIALSILGPAGVMVLLVGAVVSLVSDYGDTVVLWRRKQ